MHRWANKARSWLLRTLKFRIIWIYQYICQRLSLPLYNTHPAWLSLTNELKFVDYRHQINSLSLVNLLLLINKFSFICEGQSCRVRITIILSPQWDFLYWKDGTFILNQGLVNAITVNYRNYQIWHEGEFYDDGRVLAALNYQGSFCVCTQPMRAYIGLPLAGCIHKMMPELWLCP